LICIPVLYLGQWALATLIFAMLFWAVFEFSRTRNKRLKSIRMLVLTFIILVYGLLLNGFPDAAYIFFIVPGFFLIVFFLFSTSLHVRSLFLILFCITSIESILLISQQSDRSGYDSGLIVLFLFFITSLNDILQYICGTLFGKNHLAPYLSPNKTIEGAVGGIFLTGIIVAATLPFIVTIAWPTAIIVGMFISILGILGDLSFSYYKRQAKIKDIGTSMPGHGGLLDRIDSLTLTAPGFGICLSMIS
jgi:phosphatidate cytidylyltransferase